MAISVLFVQRHVTSLKVIQHHSKEQPNALSIANLAMTNSVVQINT